MHRSVTAHLLLSVSLAPEVNVTELCVCAALCFLADTDECVDESLCVGGQCVNTDGSYVCFCTHPMVLDPSSNHCVFFPEVLGKSGNQHAGLQTSAAKLAVKLLLSNGFPPLVLWGTQILLLLLPL